MRACLKKSSSATSSAASSPPSSPSPASSECGRVRKCVQFCAETRNEVFPADEWDRSPADVTPRLSYQDILELKEIQRSLPRAEQPMDPDFEPEPEFLLNVDVDTDVDEPRVRPQHHYLRGVPIGLLPLLPRAAIPRAPPPSSRWSAQSAPPNPASHSQPNKAPSPTPPVHDTPPAPLKAPAPVQALSSAIPASHTPTPPNVTSPPSTSPASPTSPTDRFGSKFRFLPLLDSMTPEPPVAQDAPSSQPSPKDSEPDATTPIDRHSPDTYNLPTPTSTSPSPAPSSLPPSPSPTSPSFSYFSLPITRAQHTSAPEPPSPTHTASPTLSTLTASPALTAYSTTTTASSAVSTPPHTTHALAPSFAHSQSDDDLDFADLDVSPFPPLADVLSSGGSGAPHDVLPPDLPPLHTLPAPALKALPSPALLPPSPFSLYPSSPAAKRAAVRACCYESSSSNTDAETSEEEGCAARWRVRVSVEDVRGESSDSA